MSVCHWHGGAAPQTRAAAERRVAQAQAVAHAERVFGVPLAGEVNPDQLVLAEIAHTAGAVRWLRARVAGLDADAVGWGVTQQEDRTSGVGRAGVDTRQEARVNVYVVLLAEWSDRLTRQCEVAHRMGIERRQTELAEVLGGQLAEVLSGVLDELDLTRAQRARAHEVVPARLRALTGGLGT